MAGRTTVPISTDPVSRRDFLRTGGLSMVGLTLAEQAALAGLKPVNFRRRAIFIHLSGGASQLETFDPKPEAPNAIRGPLRAISTSVPGVALSECLPRLATRLHEVALIRSLHHTAAPVHGASQQLLLQGRLVEAGICPPQWSSVVGRYLKGQRAVPANVSVPQLLCSSRPDNHADDQFAPQRPLIRAPHAHAERRYGAHEFGRLLHQSFQQLQAGVRCVTVHLGAPAESRISWDAHGDAVVGPATVHDYRDTLGPAFDQGFCALLDDLRQEGLLAETLVIATGEFGRTPQLNDQAGRGHWTDAWSAVIAGGGIHGGTVIGRTDRHAGEILDTPVEASQLPATLISWFGINAEKLETCLRGTPQPLIAAMPLKSLWG